jgi:hypothetical protein
MTLDKIYKHSNLTICEVTCDDGTKLRVGVPFESEDETELLTHISENYKTSQEEIHTDCGPTEEFLAVEYRYKRASEYPPIADYLDGVVKGNQAQIDAYIAACQAVKTKYPKPE